MTTPSSEAYEAVIIGGGVAGCCMGVALGNQGRRVLVIERDLKEPDRIIGELMQPAGMDALRELGLEDCVEDIDAVEVVGYGLHYKGESCGLKYPQLPSGDMARGWSFHHGRFIQQLRKKLMATPNVEVVEGTVLDLVREFEGTPNEAVTGVMARFRRSEGTEFDEINIRAGLTLACDGCYSRFRLRAQTAALGDPKKTPKVRVGSHMVGAIVKDVKLPYDKSGNVFLIKPTPVLFYQIGTHETRVLVDVAGEKLPPRDELVAYLSNVVAPQLPESVRVPYLEAIADPSALRTMPSQVMSAFTYNTPGVVLVGDSLNMRNPLTGGGMTCGIRDIVLLSKLWKPIKNLGDREAIANTRAPFLSLRKPLVGVINVLSVALYDVFSVDKDEFDQLREACFYYLASGGFLSRGPVGFLSGLNTSPMLLITHFFAVAAYGTWRVTMPLPTPRKCFTAASLFAEAANIMLPLLARESLTPLGYLAKLFYN